LALRAATPLRHATRQLTRHAVFVDRAGIDRGRGSGVIDQRRTCGSSGRGQAAKLRERRHGESARASRVLSSRRLPQTLRSCPPQTPTTSLSCSQKIVVTVDLENNRLYETEQLNFGVSCVNRYGRQMVMREQAIAAESGACPNAPVLSPSACRQQAAARCPPLPAHLSAAPPTSAPAPATMPPRPTASAATCGKTSAWQPRRRPCMPPTRSPTTSTSTAGRTRRVAGQAELAAGAAV
jgi:hypothetical protein